MSTTYNTDPKTLRYTITIDVYQGCSQCRIDSKEEFLDYHNIVGVLEITKTMYIHDASLENRKLMETTNT